MSKAARACEYCGKEFWAEKREINRGNGRFCSRNCAASFGNQKRFANKDSNCTCAFCEKLFYRKPSRIRSTSVYCSPTCFYKATHPLYEKSDLIDLIRSFVRANGRIPLYEEFASDQNYPDPDTYRVSFGGWNRAIELAGFAPNDSSLGFVVKAEDGHVCRSLPEKIIDDWLTERRINHEKEVLYPGSNLRADWKVGKTIIEYLGISLNYQHSLNRNYKISLESKRRICEACNLTLIEIYPEDLDALHEKLSSLSSLECTSWTTFFSEKSNLTRRKEKSLEIADFRDSRYNAVRKWGSTE